MKGGTPHSRRPTCLKVLLLLTGDEGYNQASSRKQPAFALPRQAEDATQSLRLRD